MKVFLIENINSPWGDWGDIFWAGLISWDSVNNTYELSRTGPFCPSVYTASAGFVFTKDSMEKYFLSGLSGIDDFKSLPKRKIVKSDWETWDVKADISEFLVDIFEPEDIILQGTDDEELKNTMPEYFVGSVICKAEVIIDRTVKHASGRYALRNVPAVDFFTGEKFNGFFVTEKAVHWLEKFFQSHFEYHQINVYEDSQTF